MWTKVILALVLLAFVGVQFANSLKCYVCDNVDSCAKPKSQVCNNATANASSEYLTHYHSNVPVISGSENFKCANLTYYYKYNEALLSTFKGCIHADVPICSLQMNASIFDLISDCHNCTTDLCNGNPAGTFSSSMYTVIASAMALLLAKMLRW